MVIKGSRNRSAVIYQGIDDANYLLAAQATSATVTTLITRSTLLAPMDPIIGKIVITPGGVTADVPADDVIVVGEDLQGQPQTENITLLANQATAEEGALVFRVVNSITFPIQDGVGATYDVGLIPDMDILIKGSQHKLVETRVTFASAITEVEAVVATVEYPAATVHNFILSSDDVDTLLVLRKPAINLEGLRGFNLRWAFDATDDVAWGFVAIFEQS